MQEERSIFELDEPLEYAEPWRRLLAYIIDAIILGIIQEIFGFIFGILLGTESITYLAIYVPFVIVLNWLYFAYLESSPTQATLGKRALNIRVVSTSGERISFKQGTVRYLAKILSAIILLIGYIMIIFDKDKQGLHDKLANTYVVH
jgi:uncharacterized RDD family membrane protein YckC